MKKEKRAAEIWVLNPRIFPVNAQVNEVLYTSWIKIFSAHGNKKKTTWLVKIRRPRMLLLPWQRWGSHKKWRYFLLLLRPERISRILEKEIVSKKIWELHGFGVGYWTNSGHDTEFLSSCLGNTFVETVGNYVNQRADGRKRPATLKLVERTSFSKSR